MFNSCTMSQNGLRFKISSGNFTSEPIKKVRIVVPNRQDTADEKIQCSGSQRAHLTINRSHHFQAIIGFGGAFTGAVSYLMNKIPTASRNCIYRLDARLFTYETKKSLKFLQIVLL